MPSRVVRCSAIVLILSALLAPRARAVDEAANSNQGKLAEGRRALGSMRDSYAYVLRKEEAARVARDGVLVNTLHQIDARIADLLRFAEVALDDMRVAISSNEPPEAVDVQLDKIMLAKAKVEQARSEAERSERVREVAGEDGDKISRQFLNDADALSPDDPLTGMAKGNTLPPPAGTQPPPGSRTQP